MNGTIVTPEPTIGRDRWGRPMVVPPNGGKPVAYRRATTYIKVIEDTYNLGQWMQRMVALGLASRPDLLLSVSAHRDDKKALNKIVDDAREAAAASAAATTGTALHALTELIDRGQDLPAGLPDTAKASLEAYRVATAPLKAKHIERFTVLDTHQVGGTPDRVVEVGGESYIADVKTGSIEYGALTIAMQLAIYSRAWLYDIATHERSAHGASTTRGLIIHLPADPEKWADPTKAECHLHWVDLEAGWDAVKVAAQIWEQRKRKFADLTEPFTGPPGRPSLHAAKAEETREAGAVAEQVAKLERMIRACNSADEIRALWSVHASQWDDHLTAVARDHIQKLPTTV